MLLVLSKGGRGAREISECLSRNDGKFMFWFEDLSEAGGFGKGDVIVGKLSYRSLLRTVKQNRITGIIDSIPTPEAHGSLVALNVAEDLKLPLAKLIRPTVPKNISVAADPKKVDTVIEYSYEKVASKINNTVGNAVFLSRPVNVRIIAEKVFDRNALYVPIAEGAEFDVDLALGYGVPLLNVKQYNDFFGREGILRVLKDTEAKLLITDSAADISDKLAAAGEAGAQVIFTQSSGYDYENIFDNLNGLEGFLEEKGLLRETEPSEAGEREEEVTE